VFWPPKFHPVRAPLKPGTWNPVRVCPAYDLELATEADCDPKHGVSRATALDASRLGRGPKAVDTRACLPYT